MQHLHKRAGRKAKGITVDRTIMPGNIAEPLRIVRSPDLDNFQRQGRYGQNTLKFKEIYKRVTS